MFHQDWEITWYLENLMNDRCGCGEFGSLAAHSKAEWNRQVWLGGFIQSWFGINRVWTDVYPPQIGQLSKLFNVDALWRGEWLGMLNSVTAGGMGLKAHLHSFYPDKEQVTSRDPDPESQLRRWECENLCILCDLCDLWAKREEWPLTCV